MRCWRAVREMIRFEILWKLLFFLLINPVFRDVYQTYVASVGLSFNGGMLWTFLTPKVALIFLALLLGAGCLVFYEYCVAIRIAALCRRGEAFTLAQVMKAAVWDLGTLRGWSLPAGALYFVLLLPMARLGYVSTMVPLVTVPEFVFEEMRKSLLGQAGMLAFYMVQYAAHLLLIFAPLRMTLRHERLGQAARGSLRLWRRSGWKRGIAVVAALAVWERVFTELARYWRRNLLGNDDFDRYILKYLLYSQAFRKDLLFWLLASLLQTAAMALFLFFLVGALEREGMLLQPAWSRDGLALWDMLARRSAAWRARWEERLRTQCWRCALGALGLAAAAGLVLSCSQPLLVHRPLAIAHRGGTGGVENSLTAVLAAAEAGADCAEIDVQLTKDGVPVLFHDGNLRRMAGRGESVGELTWAELREIPIEDHYFPEAGERIPSLEEVLAALTEGGTDMGLLIELKPAAGTSEALSWAVMELVEDYGFGERAMFMSLDYLCLLPLQERHPEWWTGFCAYSTAGDIDDAVFRYGMDFLAVEESLASNRLATQARELNLPVYVWSVYDNERMLQYLEMGISGIISDYPEEAVSVRERYERANPGIEYCGAPSDFQ